MSILIYAFTQVCNAETYFHSSTAECFFFFFFFLPSVYGIKCFIFIDDAAATQGRKCFVTTSSYLLSSLEPNALGDLIPSKGSVVPRHPRPLLSVVVHI